MPADGSHFCCKLGDFIVWLHQLGNDNARRLLRALVSWIQLIADYGDYWDGLGSDPLHIPVPQTQSGRARRVPARLKEAVARTAAAGDHGRSGAKVLKNLKKFSGVVDMVADAVGNTWTEPSMRRYLGATQGVMGSVVDKIYSLSWDATRLSGKDLLFASMWTSEGQIASWCSPMVPTVSE